MSQEEATRAYVSFSRPGCAAVTSRRFQLLASYFQPKVTSLVDFASFKKSDVQSTALWIAALGP